MIKFLGSVVCNEMMINLYYDTVDEIYFIAETPDITSAIDCNMSLLILFENNDMDTSPYPHLFHSTL